jgi:hypothetical protein
MKKREALPKFPHQFFYFTGLCIRRGLNAMSNRLVAPHMAVYERAQGFWVSRAIVAACELNLAEHLAEGPKGIRELSVLTNTDEENLYRLMRMLAGEGIFVERRDKIFENNRYSKVLIEGEGSMKNLIMHQFCENNQKLFTVFRDVIHTGESYTRKIFGKSIFQFLEENPEKNMVYNKAMDDSSGLIALAIVGAYNFRGIRTLVDIGGGHGIILAEILRRHRKMQGILFDQPHVVGPSIELMTKYGVQNRLKILSGDFFEDIPAGADAYFMKNILHAFSDEDCSELLRKVHHAMADGGRLIIVDSVLKPDNQPALGKRLDLLMMVGTEGGKERTREQFKALLEGSGFKLKRIIRTVAPFSIVEAVKQI